MCAHFPFVCVRCCGSRGRLFGESVQCFERKFTMSVEENDISWALKLLEREPEYEMNFLAKHWARICAPMFGVIVAMGGNYWFRRPMYSGFQRHILFGIIGFGVGHAIMERERYVAARRDAILRDYIRLHPEDFPEPERRKFADIFDSWNPIR